MSDRQRLEAVRRRLLGHVVRTPVIGEPLLPGLGATDRIRIKPECLQPGRSLRFRGALHAFLRALGAWKGTVLAGDSAEVFAECWAAHLLRVPAVAVVSDADAADGSGPPWELLPDVARHHAARARLEGTARALAAEHGYVLFDRSAADVLDGIATVGLELADELAADVDAVFVAPPDLAAPISAGFAAAGREVAVCGVAASEVAPARRRAVTAALRRGVGLECNADSAAALDAALEAGRAACVVLAG